ncbi:MAG: hypothetical protein ABH842_02570 [Candidatus Micrarchaeota archaeon]
MNIQEKFDGTALVLFGTVLGEIDDFEKTLSKKLPRTVGEKGLTIPQYGSFKKIPKNKVVPITELDRVGQHRIEIGPGENLETISEKWSEKAIFVADLNEGINNEVIDSAIYYNLTNAYKIIDCFSSKHIAYSFFSDNCDHAFGIEKCFDCSFVMNVRASRKITRAYEVDFSENCSDIMFCHNVANVKDSLFCHNVKNLRYAVLNKVVGKEEYLRIKKMVIEEIIKKLKTKNSYFLACT